MGETWPCHPSPNEVAPTGCVVQAPVDCIFASWREWGDCSATCGGGERTRSRDIAQRPSDGGMACRGVLSEIAECARQSCRGLARVNCVYGQWTEWGACNKCGGERFRTRNIARYPENGGEACQYIATEEAGKCPRKCNQKLYCTWSHWDDWSRCTATCGTGGKRARRRYLELSDDPRAEELLPTDEMVLEYETLFKRTNVLEENHYQEILVAFGAGGTSLVLLMVAIRTSLLMCCRERALAVDRHLSPALSRVLDEREQGESRSLSLSFNRLSSRPRYLNLLTADDERSSTSLLA